MLKILKVTYIILTIATIIFFILGRKNLKKVKEGKVDNDENYKKGVYFILIFSFLATICIVLSGIALFLL